MRLNNSPKIVLDKLDELVRVGRELLDEMTEDYLLEWLDPQNTPNPNPHNKSQQKMPKYLQRHSKWINESKESLANIFQDAPPGHLFLSAGFDAWKLPTKMSEMRQYEVIVNDLDEKLKVLSHFYELVSVSAKSPLSYIKNKAIICFYDFDCPLKIMTNEATLCQVLFSYPIGRPIDQDQIFGEMNGEGGYANLEFSNKDKLEIKHAYEGINNKTRKTFGFPIIKSSKNTLKIVLPSEIISRI